MLIPIYFYPFFLLNHLFSIYWLLSQGSRTQSSAAREGASDNERLPESAATFVRPKPRKPKGINNQNLLKENSITKEGQQKIKGANKTIMNRNITKQNICKQKHSKTIVNRNITKEIPTQNVA